MSTAWIVVFVIGAIVVWFYYRNKPRSLASIKRSLHILPAHFIVMDLETTGLDSRRHEIIEIGAIRANRDSSEHTTFQAFVQPIGKVPKAITKLTGITQGMLDENGEPLKKVLQEFSEFAGNLRIVTYNADFDMAFLHAAAIRSGCGLTFRNPVSCALKMARRAWPGRRSYKLADLSRDGGLSQSDSHRAIGDCLRTLTVYTAAVDILQSI